MLHKEGSNGSIKKQKPKIETKSDNATLIKKETNAIQLIPINESKKINERLRESNLMLNIAINKRNFFTGKYKMNYDIEKSSQDYNSKKEKSKSNLNKIIEKNSNKESLNQKISGKSLADFYTNKLFLNSNNNHKFDENQKLDKKVQGLNKQLNKTSCLSGFSCFG